MGMGVPVCPLKSFSAEVSIDLGGSKVLVPEEFLHLSQIGPAVEHVSREGVPEGVGAGLSVESRPVYVSIEDLADGSVGDALAEAIEDHWIVGAERTPFGGDALPVFRQCLEGETADGNDALPSPLAEGAQNSGIFVDIAPVDRYQFADANAAAVENLDDASISGPTEGLDVGALDETDHFRSGEEVGE